MALKSYVGKRVLGIAFVATTFVSVAPTGGERGGSLFFTAAIAGESTVEPSLWERAKQKLGSTYSNAIDSAKALWARGPAYAKTQFKGIWTGIKSLDCLKIVDGFSGFDPATLVLDRLWKASGTCLREFRKGFICAIPYLVGEVARLGIASIESAWKHRSECFKVAVVTGPLATGGFAACGFYYFLKENLTKATACLRALNRNQIWKLFWEAAWKLGCWVAGELAADFVLESLSGGAGTPALIAKWAKRIATMLPTSEWMGLSRLASKLGERGVNALVWTADSAAYYVRDVAGELVECGGSAKPKSKPPARATSSRTTSGDSSRTARPSASGATSASAPSSGSGATSAPH